MYKHIEKEEKKLTDEEKSELEKKVEEQQAEIERLTSLYEGQTAFMTSSIGDLPLTVEGLRKAVDEISRLLTVQGELQDLNIEYYNDAKDLRRENAELQKQVDELKASREIEINELHEQHAIVAEEIKKDTAKEILRTLIEKAYVNECIDLTVAEVKAWFREDYGVEV